MINLQLEKFFLVIYELVLKFENYFKVRKLKYYQQLFN